MTDTELLQATAQARGAAHRAPFAEWSKDHEGHSAIVNHTNGWAERASEFAALMVEIKRRGLATPPCDCPSGSH